MIIFQILNKASHANEIKKIHVATPDKGKHKILYIALDHLTDNKLAGLHFLFHTYILHD